VYVPRTQLWQRLDEVTDNPLTLLVGPMGSGKTLGVSGWVRLGRAARDPDDAVWLHGDPAVGPDDLARVLDQADEARPSRWSSSTTPTSCRRPHCGTSTTGSVQSPRPCDCCSSHGGPPHHPPRSGAARPPLSCAARSCASPSPESAVLVAEHCSDLAEVARIITDRTEGWCGATMLAARAVGNFPDRRRARRFETKDLAAADRVASEVFAALQPRERHLLLSVAGNDVVSAETAAHSRTTRARARCWPGSRPPDCS
jgi:hypothetical protein